MVAAVAACTRARDRLVPGVSGAGDARDCSGEYTCGECTLYGCEGLSRGLDTATVDGAKGGSCGEGDGGEGEGKGMAGLGLGRIGEVWPKNPEISSKEAVATGAVRVIGARCEGKDVCGGVVLG